MLIAENMVQVRDNRGSSEQQTLTLKLSIKIPNFEHGIDNEKLVFGFSV